ncbi:MAG TPA: rod shape-determining protein MreC [Longimicrobiales bacterium]|nr:rod shape-determining protein MreC [Longimicrobiales bacterium]
MPASLPPRAADERGAQKEFRLSLLVLFFALVVVNLPDGAQSPMASFIRGTVLRPFLAMQESLVAARNRSVEVDALQAQIDSLTARAVARTTVEAENRLLRGLLDLSGELGPGWRAVRVLRPGTSDSRSTLLVDAGTEDGIALRAPLITREGLAGVIREALPDQSVGMDWSHPDFRASAMTLDGFWFGLVESRAGPFREADRLILMGVPFNAPVDSGTVVVTSGLGVLPRGIPIGRIRAVADSVGGWQKSYWLDPFVEPGSVTHALVALEGTAVSDDVTGTWTEAELLRAQDRAARLRLLGDSLRAALDSLQVLEGTLRALTAPDTAGGGGS